jgi:hypothetical protein
LLIVVPAFAQTSLPRYEAHRAAAPVVIDGKLDDKAWAAAQVRPPASRRGWSTVRSGTVGLTSPQGRSPENEVCTIDRDSRNMAML